MKYNTIEDKENCVTSKKVKKHRKYDNGNKGI